MKPKTFSYNSFEAIPFYCTFNFSVDTNPQPIERSAIRSVDKRKIITIQAAPLSVHRIVLPPFSYQSGFGKRISFQLCRKSLAPFSSTSVNNCTTSTGAHARTKTMGTTALNVTWLKSSFAHCYLPSI